MKKGQILPPIQQDPSNKPFSQNLEHSTEPLATADLTGLDVVLDTPMALCEHADPIRDKPHPVLTKNGPKKEAGPQKWAKLFPRPKPHNTDPMKQDAIKEILHTYPLSLTGAENLEEEDDLFALGYLKSLHALQWLEFLEERFYIELDDKDLNLENFQTLNALTRTTWARLTA